MKQSKLFTKTIKELPKDEISFNAQALMRAGFVDKLSAGVYTFLPLGLRVHNKIINIIREEMEKLDGQEVLMPGLIAKENWGTTGRWDFDALFKLTGANKKEYALGATHEEVVTPLAKKFVFSHNDLPLSIYQIQTKFRNEKRAKAGLIRGREFSMKDLYSFHTDEKDFDEYYEKATKVYFDIFARMGIGDITHLTYASGGAFSKYSHEFQTVCSAGEDTIYLCPKCKIAVNKEIIEEQNVCPECGGKDFEEKKSVEVGNIFKLGTKFSKPFELQYTNDKGEKNYVVMGCFGIGPSRLMGTIVEALHDDRGIIWPEEIAPFKVHLISLNKNEEAEGLYNELVEAGIEVLYDDRDNRAGEKFAEADMIGCPYRIVVSNKSLEQGGVEIKRRNEEEGKIIKIKEVKDNV